MFLHFMVVVLKYTLYVFFFNIYIYIMYNNSYNDNINTMMTLQIIFIVIIQHCFAIEW